MRVLNQFLDFNNNMSYECTFVYLILQEIWANAHEMCDSISLISYAGCLGLFPVISAKIQSLNVPPIPWWVV